MLFFHAFYQLYDDCSTLHLQSSFALSNMLFIEKKLLFMPFFEPFRETEDTTCSIDALAQVYFELEGYVCGHLGQIRAR